MLIGTGDTKDSVAACTDDLLLLPLLTSVRLHPYLITTVRSRAKQLWYIVLLSRCSALTGAKLVALWARRHMVTTTNLKISVRVSTNFFNSEDFEVSFLKVIMRLRIILRAKKLSFLD